MSIILIDHFCSTSTNTSSIKHFYSSFPYLFSPNNNLFFLNVCVWVGGRKRDYLNFFSQSYICDLMHLGLDTASVIKSVDILLHSSDCTATFLWLLFVFLPYLLLSFLHYYLKLTSAIILKDPA